MLGFRARQTAKPARLGCKCQKISDTVTNSSSPAMSVPFQFCQIAEAVTVTLLASRPRSCAWRGRPSPVPRIQPLAMVWGLQQMGLLVTFMQVCSHLGAATLCVSEARSDCRTSVTSWIRTHSCLSLYPFELPLNKEASCFLSLPTLLQKSAVKEHSHTDVCVHIYLQGNIRNAITIT